MSAIAPIPNPARGGRLATQLVRFGVVGASNTVLTLAIYTALATAVPAVAAAAVGWCAGALNGYRLNRRWTFASGACGATPVLRYTGVQAVAGVLNAAAVWALVRNAGAPHVVAELVGLPMAAALAFVLCRWWVFA